MFVWGRRPWLMFPKALYVIVGIVTLFVALSNDDLVDSLFLYSFGVDSLGLLGVPCVYLIEFPY
jgi:hypothetical protein